MAFEKMKIINLDSKEEISVLYNPTALTIDDSSSWQDQTKNGYRPEIQYTGGGRKKLSMELFFDTYEQAGDVRVHTDKIAELLEPTIDSRGNGEKQNQGKRPPKVSIHWGAADNDMSVRILPSTWVLEKLTQKFTLFMDNGTPVRATLTAAFIEFLLPSEQAKRNPKRKSFPYQTYTVKEGDTISDIANTYWSDPAKWRLIAKENRIDNPLLLKVGQALLIPATK